MASEQSASGCTGSKPVKCTYDENGTDPVAQFSYSDPDTSGITWSLKDDDYKSFDISASGQLTFKKAPDFEKKSSYKVTVTTSAGGEHKVEVTITNLEEDGEVTFSGNPQPQVGESLRAILKDGDGGEFNKVWQWSRSEDKVEWTAIATARASLYTVSADDVGHYLQATVTYRDALGSDQQTAEGVTAYKARVRPTANKAPEFPDQNLELAGVQNDEIEREVAENSANGTSVGEPVVAFDTDGDEIVHTVGDADINGDGTVDGSDTVAIGGVTYTAAVDDSDAVDIDATTGQITVKDKAKLDFELASGVNDDDAYVVTVTATDPSGASGTITVVIKVKDVNEAPKIADAGGATDAVNPAATISLPENIAAITVGGTPVSFTADDPDLPGADNTQEVDWSVAGPDAKFFSIVTTGASGRKRPHLQGR